MDSSAPGWEEGGELAGRKGYEGEERRVLGRQCQTILIANHQCKKDINNISAIPGIRVKTELASHVGSEFSSRSLVNVSRIRCKLSQPDKI